MTKSQAKKLAVGDKVVQHDGETRISGSVVRKRYNTIRIIWEDGVGEDCCADSMSNIWTDEQLAALAEQQRVVEKVKEINRGGLKKPFRGID